MLLVLTKGKHLETDKRKFLLRQLKIPGHEILKNQFTRETDFSEPRQSGLIFTQIFESNKSVLNPNKSIPSFPYSI